MQNYTWLYRQLITASDCRARLLKHLNILLIKYTDKTYFAFHLVTSVTCECHGIQNSETEIFTCEMLFALWWPFSRLFALPVNSANTNSELVFSIFSWQIGMLTIFLSLQIKKGGAEFLSKNNDTQQPWSDWNRDGDHWRISDIVSFNWMTKIRLINILNYYCAAFCVNI